MANRPRKNRYVFRKHDSIGAADAREDERFLKESFIDNGEIEILTDLDRPECIILGRTGSGKTALIERLRKTEERSIAIEPDSLALTYVSDSNVLSFFVNAGVNMDLFYRLLWRHVFAIEIIKKRYGIVNERSRDSFLQQLGDRIKGEKSKQEAIDYLREWGESFWQETDYRVKEITKKMEDQLGQSVEGSIGASVPSVASGGLKFTSDSAKTLTEETKAEVVQRGQQVVDQVQIRILSEIIKLLDSDILDDRKKNYFITIDRLDENWVNEDLRYFLLRALFETIRDFNNSIRNVKIIVAIREDLLGRIFRYTRSPGYQEEKYKSMYLNLAWTEEELKNLLDKRVNQLVREQYTSQVVSLSDILPKKVNKKESGTKYLLERTMFRPRDAIMFFNECIQVAVKRATINQSMLMSAEAKYSENRLRALADEWSADYPNLIELCLLLKKFPRQFKPSEHREAIADSMIGFLVEFEDQPSERHDYIFHSVQKHFEDGDIDAFIVFMGKTLYKVGLIGIKHESYSGTSWSFLGDKPLGFEITPTVTYSIHPAFWRVLGISPES